MMLTLFTLNWLQSLAFPLHVSTQHLNIKENVLTSTTPFLLLQSQLSSTSFLLLGAFSGKVPCSITTKTYYFWQVSRFPFLGNCWGSALTPCTCNRLYGLGCSWAPIGFSSWTFPCQSWLLFLVGHILLPLSGILLDPRSNNSGRCVLLLHMNSKT